MPQKAIGLPDPEEYGSITSLKPGSILPFYVQKHLARKAGPHYDVRLGEPGGKLLSWAVRKGLPKPGQKHLGIQQALHEESYGGWSGTIPRGYGAGKVESKIRGKALITSSDKNGVTFVTAHEKHPQRFRLQRTPRGWLLINVTPAKKREYGKVHYKKVDEKEIDQLFNPANLISAKIDGSAEWVEILGDKIESLSYRTSKQTGRPIVHTERVGSPRLKEKLKDTVLRGELYGVKDGKVISAAELGGLLNSVVALSLAKQQKKNIKLKHAVFDILRHEGKDLTKLPYGERLRILEDVVKKLPPEFHIPEGYTDPVKQRRLWQRIKKGQHPLTVEGIVAHPLADGVPQKVKTFKEYDVYIRDVFPGKGRLEGTGAGGFRYSLTPGGPVVGAVGTGFSDEDRRDMLTNPDVWVGRRARIESQEQFPSGAYRAPGFIARHEDYPQEKVAMNKTAFLRGYGALAGAGLGTGSGLLAAHLFNRIRGKKGWKPYVVGGLGGAALGAGTGAVLDIEAPKPDSTLPSRVSELDDIESESLDWDALIEELKNE